jgi:lipoprotein-anchoring transpeptidase ErfK/SrfK
VAALACLALPASVSARLTATPSATWTAPTPAEGKRLSAALGREFVVALAATAPGAPAVSVSIRAQGLPARAAFQPVTGNPATATVSWRPTKAQAGRTFNVTFTAEPSVPAVAPVTRHVTLHVPKPKLKRKPKPKTFVLSSSKQELYRYAFVIRSVVARSAPRRTSASVATLARWTPEGTTNLVMTLEGRRTPRGVWIKVRLPVLPANRTGWVPRKALSDWKELRTRLVVDRRRLTATLYRRGKVAFRAPVGVGLSQWPTPRGEFFIRNQLYGFGNPVYGPIAFGTSARSAVLTDWPGGGFIGIHGTNQPYLVPGRISHGCIRMKNGHILRLAKLMPVGTPLTVR